MWYKAVPAAGPGVYELSVADLAYYDIKHTIAPVHLALLETTSSEHPHFVLSASDKAIIDTAVASFAASTQKTDGPAAQSPIAAAAVRKRRRQSMEDDGRRTQTDVGRSGRARTRVTFSD
jgi:hypothetical protein